MAHSPHKMKSAVVLAAAAAAGAIGTYLLAGPHGAKNRKKVRGWMVQAKGEVMEKVEALKKIDADAYAQIVDEVIERYREGKNISAKELAALGKELKSSWDTIVKKTKKQVKKTKNELV